jgi:hypothetical protein
MTPREMLRRYFSGSDYRCDDLMNVLHSAGYRILGPGELDKETLEKCAEVVQPKGPRPCDCDRCYCGNVGDLEMVTAWDQQEANATAIRALAKEKQGC